MNEPQDSQAFLAASLTFGVWASWVGASSKVHTIQLVGPFLFWSFPVVIGFLAWLLILVRAPRVVPIERRILGAVTGVVATSVGFPLSVLSGILLALGAFWPLMFFSLVLEAIILAIGFAAMFGLYREAFRTLRAHPGAEASGRRTTG